MEEKTPKIEKKETESHISVSGKISYDGEKTMVRRVMETIYGFNRPLKVKEIVRDTALTEKQVWRVIQFLSASEMITKTYENFGAKHRIPPIRMIKVSLTPSQFKKAGRFLHGN